MIEVLWFVIGFFAGGITMMILGIRFAAAFGGDILDEAIKMGKISKQESGIILDRVKARK